MEPVGTASQDHMDAQQIVLDTDPEAASTDNIPEHNSESNKKACLCRALLWYISPISCNIGHSILCLIYHVINFGFAMALLIFDATAIFTSVGLTALFCIGLILLWFTFEVILVLSRIDLGITYYLVEEKSKIDESRQHLLTLSLYFTDFPLCCCWNRDNNSMSNIMLSRMKYLFTSCDLLKYVVYQMFIKPIGLATWAIVIVVGINAGIVFLPIWYAVDNSMFKQNKISFGYDSDCDYPNNGGVFCDNDPIWIVNTLGRTFFWAFLALLVLPLTVRFSNYLAYLNKVIAYYFYTYYYTEDESIIQDKRSLLNARSVRINSV